MVTHAPNDCGACRQISGWCAAGPFTCIRCRSLGRWLAVTFTDVVMAPARRETGRGAAAFDVQLRAFERSRRLEVSYGSGVDGSDSRLLFPSGTPLRVRWGPYALLASGDSSAGVRSGSTLLIAADCTSDANCATGGDGTPLVCTSGACRERGAACARTGIFTSTEPVYPAADHALSAFLVSSSELADVTHDALFIVVDGVRLALPLTPAPFVTPSGDVLPGAFRFRADVPPTRPGAHISLAAHHSSPVEPGMLREGNTALLRVSVLVHEAATAVSRRAAALNTGNATAAVNPGGACPFPRHRSRLHAA